MNEKPKRSLDRRAALAAIVVIQLAVLILAPVVWRENFSVPGAGNMAYLRLVDPWAYSLACMTGFACACVPAHWVRRLFLGCAACLWSWSALFWGHKLAGASRYSQELGSYWILNLGFVALFTAAIFLVLKRALHLRLIAIDYQLRKSTNLRQFSLRDLMSLVLLICVTLAACRSAGPIGLPPFFMVSFDYMLNMVTVSLMGVCAILAAFSRKYAIVFLLIFPLLVSFDVGLILALQLSISQWTQFGPMFLKIIITHHGILAANCLLMTLLLRWLGYASNIPSSPNADENRTDYAPQTLLPRDP